MDQTTADGLRALADWLDTCDGSLEFLNGSRLEVGFYALGLGKEEAASIAAIAKKLRTFDKSYSDSLMIVSKKFGPITAQFVAYRESVCKRVVVGTEEVPEQVIPATEAKVIPAYTREKVEWDCTSSLLAPEFAALESESA